jgi:hypothetical protein
MSVILLLFFSLLILSSRDGKVTIPLKILSEWQNPRQRLRVVQAVESQLCTAMMEMI